MNRKNETTNTSIRFPKDVLEGYYQKTRIGNDESFYNIWRLKSNSSIHLFEMPGKEEYVLYHNVKEVTTGSFLQMMQIGHVMNSAIWQEKNETCEEHDYEVTEVERDGRRHRDYFVCRDCGKFRMSEWTRTTKATIGSQLDNEYRPEDRV
mgnify:CR=1 FL=1|tara:strand:+ start:138 stop:587 length:450 start_codon:yes stop_codon:yes gene_type:complete